MESRIEMRIQGMQKLTLLDYPSKVACTFFAPGCNFRCPFCHNAGIVLEPATEGIKQADALSFLKKRKGVLDGVCISGGEPTLQPGLKDFIRCVKDMDLDVKLDTNGSFPAILENLISEGLVDYIAMDIKSSPENYDRVTGTTVDMNAIRRSADLLMRGELPFEFRTTLVRELHSIRDIEEIGQWLCGNEKYFLQTFVDSGQLIADGLTAFPAEDMESMRRALQVYIPQTELR
jgi:pyruvate formate lyase activating enzyme